MTDWAEQREARLREFFGLDAATRLITEGGAGARPEVTPHMERFNLEWHVIPPADVIAFDEAYVRRLYPMAPRDFTAQGVSGASLFEALATGHRRHQGQFIGVEATPKPRYLPGNRQFYGTAYGFDATADPFMPYLGSAGFLTRTRYAHNYISLRAFINVINEDWRRQSLMPRGYRLTICPPAVFNLIGTVFHPEWSATESLELGFYRDDSGNAKCYNVGSNAPGDFSFIHEIESDSDWTMLGFRTALIPDN